MKKTLSIIFAIVSASYGLFAGPASEAYVTNKVAQARAEAMADASAKIAAATNGIPERIAQARVGAVNDATQHVAGVRAEIQSAANAASEALSRATSATNDVRAVSNRLSSVETGLTTERDARTVADAALDTRIDGVSSTAQSALARAVSATNAAAGLSTRVSALESGSTTETERRVAADTALGARIDALTNSSPASSTAQYITDGTNTIWADLSVPYLSLPINGSGIWRLTYINGTVEDLHWHEDANTWYGDYGAVSFEQPNTLKFMSSDGIFRQWYAEANKRNYSFTIDNRTWRYEYIFERNTKLATTNDIPTTAAQVGAFSASSGASLQNTVNSWQTYWDGDDVRVTVTNYYGQTGMPHLYLEEKMQTNATHASPWFKTVWDEMTRWTNFLHAPNVGYASVTNHVYQNLADRAWGVYDSSTGAYSPDDTLQLSQGTIVISSGMSYQKTITTGGNSVWILKSTDPTVVSGVTSNGFFSITDGDGNSLFKIVKGDKRTVGATASAFNVHNGTVTIGYNVEAGSHPILQACTTVFGQFSDETDGTITMPTATANVSWTGSSGAYLANVTFSGTAPRTCFFRATYETGGETYISNAAPLSVQSGILCTDGIHKCRPVYSNGSITWQALP